TNPSRLPDSSMEAKDTPLPRHSPSGNAKFCALGVILSAGTGRIVFSNVKKTRRILYTLEFKPCFCSERCIAAFGSPIA
ncbi:MAG: hypothetical protein ACRD33_11055, partial [Candidatus Acidiferrales bacterium]